MNENLSRYQIITKIGSGAFGTVFKALDTKLNKYVALKEIHSSNTHFINLNELQSFEKLKQTSNFIVQLYDVFKADGSIYLSFELITGGSLYQKIQKRPLNEQQTLKMLSDILSGLKVMHSSLYIHRDIKSENFLYEQSEDRFKLADLGCATSLRRNSLTAYVGTRWFRAPEVLAHLKYNEKADIFSVGLVAMESLIGKPLVQGASEISQLHGLFQTLGASQQEVEYYKDAGITLNYATQDKKSRISVIAQYLRNTSMPTAKLIAQMLALIPSERISAEEALTELEVLNKQNGTLVTSQEQTVNTCEIKNTKIELEEKQYSSAKVTKTKQVEFVDNGGLDDF